MKKNHTHSTKQKAFIKLTAKPLAKPMLFLIMIFFFSFNSYGYLLEAPRLDMSFLRLEKMSLGGEGAEYLDRQKAKEVLEKKYRNLYAKIPNKKWNFHDIELWLQVPEKTLKEKKPIAQILVKKYLDNERPQEAIWTLREFGMLEEANRIETKLIETLVNGKATVDPSFSSDGVNSIFKLTVKKEGISGIFRFKNFKQEVLAYRLDRFLGLNIIPVTVLKNFQDKKQQHTNYFHNNTFGSLQYYVKDSCSSCVMFRWEGDFREKYPENQKKMWLLDYLLENKDKHKGNWRKRFGNKPFSFDYEQILGRGAGSGSPKLQENLLPSGDLLKQLVRLNPKSLSTLDLDIDISKVFKRKEEILQKIIKKHGSGVICRALF